MKLNTALEGMEVVLNELNEQFETIKKNEVRVPQIEIDIFMATTRRLYESMTLLNKQKLQVEVEQEAQKVPEAAKPEIVSEEVPPIELLDESIIEDSLAGNTEVDPQEISFEEATIIDAELAYEKVTNDFLEEINELEEEAQHEIAEFKEANTTHEAKPEKSNKHSLLLQFEDEIFSVNESLAQKSDNKSLVNKLSNSRIENLKSAIGINDKFYFINELFAGNSQAYEDVIYTLNNFKRFEEAMQYISTLKYRYEWDTEAEAYQKLVHFLERKFIEIHA